MRLYLVQHGAAVSKETDPDRPLSPEGAHDTAEMAVFIARRNLRLDEIWHSGKTRARQTAISLAGAIRGATVRERDGLAPKDDVTPLVEILCRRETDLMIVGHLPFLSRLASVLLGLDPDREVIAFRNAGVVCLERDAEGDWRLLWALPPDLPASE
ncbi:MAG TPA: phosphohistidine phosphatase SixA [Candidatus Hydrogenedentes bacterium]|nr:phosphohistidine phosphatase SixA [Candidatus Hydrogenedentota bacterium]HNT89503.1 phosphohistidine phosphatase SixA [Candidatus Hydrogenedentota bacterium]